jgi:hypothetical protein
VYNGARRFAEGPVGRARRSRVSYGVRLRTTLACAAVLLGFAWPCAPGHVAAPQLRFEAPASLAPEAHRLEAVDPARLQAVARLVGLESPGPPIRVVLAPEDSDVARDTPPWVPAFAAGELIVVFPRRTLSYPHTTLEEVLQHEVAHVLIARAAGHRRVPRWFHEGVALLAERTWSLGERSRFAYELAAGRAVSPSELDGLFQGNEASVERAYNLSNAFVRDLVETHGPDLPARVLASMRAGREFDAAFLEAAGVTVTDASATFWRRHRLWLVWLPWVTSPQALYTLITGLALLAIWRVRARRAARRLAEEAEGAEDALDGT